jgi:hypothetical protein
MWTNGRDENYLQDFSRHLKKRVHLGDLNLDGTII